MADENKKSSFYDNVKAMAKELGLDGEDADNFINQAMEKKGGHKKMTTWVPDDGKGDKGGKQGSSWF